MLRYNMKILVVNGIHTVSFSHSLHLSMHDQGGCMSLFAAVEMMKEPSSSCPSGMVCPHSWLRLTAE